MEDPTYWLTHYNDGNASEDDSDKKYDVQSMEPKMITQTSKILGGGVEMGSKQYKLYKK